MTIQTLFETDATALAGRGCEAVVDEFLSAARLKDDDVDAMLDAELRAVAALVQLRATLTLAPTRSRTIASELVPAIAMAVGMDPIDGILADVRDWIDGMGDMLRTARRLDAARTIARHALDASLAEPGPAALEDLFGAQDELEEMERAARLEIEVAGGGTAVFRFYDAETLTATLSVGEGNPVHVAMVDIGDDDGDRASTPTPELVA